MTARHAELETASGHDSGEGRARIVAAFCIFPGRSGAASALDQCTAQATSCRCRSPSTSQTRRLVTTLRSGARYARPALCAGNRNGRGGGVPGWQESPFPARRQGSETSQGAVRRRPVARTRRHLWKAPAFRPGIPNSGGGAVRNGVRLVAFAQVQADAVPPNRKRLDAVGLRRGETFVRERSRQSGLRRA